MATDQTNQRANPNPTPLSGTDLKSVLPTEPRVLWGRPLAVAAAFVFFLSSAFPVVAGLSKDTESFPKWWGPLDVGIAFVLALLTFAIIGLAGDNVTKQAEDASYRTYRILIHGILAMIVVFFLFADRIVWSNCLTGFAWRSWLLLYSLPAWFTALKGQPEISDIRVDLPAAADRLRE
jgi:hypothetical protein